MQTAADRVDTDLREYRWRMAAPAVPIRRRVLVAIDGRGHLRVPGARGAAHRRAARCAVDRGHRADTGGPATGAPARLDQAFALARRLGGEAECCAAPASPMRCSTTPSRSGASTIVIGRTRERPFARMLNRTLTQQLLQQGAASN